MNKYQIIFCLLPISCFSPTGSSSSETFPTSDSTKNETESETNLPTTNLPTTTTITSSTTEQTTDQTTDVSTSSNSSTSPTSSSSSSGSVGSTTDAIKFDMMPSNDLPLYTCGNCRLEPGEDCDPCNGTDDTVPNLEKLGCSNSCTFTNAEFYNIGIYCEVGWSFCGNLLICDVCEADLACNIFWKRRAILEGFNPDTLSIKAKNFTEEFINQPTNGVLLSIGLDNATAFPLIYHAGAPLYQGPIILNEYSSVSQTTILHNITCEILD